MTDTRIDLKIPHLEGLSIGKETPLAQPSRLVVVLQDAEYEAALASRILELARTRTLGILLVGLASNPDEDAPLRRQLARVAAFIGDATRQSETALPVEIHMLRGMGWLESVRGLVHPGDTLACGADWYTGGLRKPLNDVLGGGLKMPVYVFADMRPETTDRRTRLTNLLGWLLSMGSVVGFCLIAARIVLATDGWLQSVLLLGALAIEIGFIYFLNSVVGWF